MWRIWTTPHVIKRRFHVPPDEVTVWWWVRKTIHIYLFGCCDLCQSLSVLLSPCRKEQGSWLTGWVQSLQWFSGLGPTRAGLYPVGWLCPRCRLQIVGSHLWTEAWRLRWSHHWSVHWHWPARQLETWRKVNWAVIYDDGSLNRFNDDSQLSHFSSLTLKSRSTSIWFWTIGIVLRSFSVFMVLISPSDLRRERKRRTEQTPYRLLRCTVPSKSIGMRPIPLFLLHTEINWVWHQRWIWDKDQYSSFQVFTSRLEDTGTRDWQVFVVAQVCPDIDHSNNK